MVFNAQVDLEVDLPLLTLIVQGQPSGEAFIQMDGETSSFNAANHRHHRYMVFGKKQRYIEVFQCSGEDMSLVLTGGGQQPAQNKPPLLSPGMLDPGAQLQQQQQQQHTVHPLYTSDPMAQAVPHLSMPPPMQLLPGLMQQQQQLSLPPPNIQQQQLALLQQLQLQGLQQQGLLALQQPGLMGMQPQQQLMLYPRLQAPLLQQQQQPRFLLPTPQLAAFPQAGGKRSHEQAFLQGAGGAQFQGGAGGLPPKRPPVMYGTPPLDAAGTPPPPGPALLPTPHALPSYPV